MFMDKKSCTHILLFLKNGCSTVLNKIAFFKNRQTFSSAAQALAWQTRGHEFEPWYQNKVKNC